MSTLKNLPPGTIIGTHHIQTGGMTVLSRVPEEAMTSTSYSKNGKTSAQQRGLVLRQRPGPNGSRVEKRRPSPNGSHIETRRSSIPRLGDLSSVKITIWGSEDTADDYDLHDDTSSATSNASTSNASQASTTTTRPDRDVTPATPPDTPCPLSSSDYGLPGGLSRNEENNGQFTPSSGDGLSALLSQGLRHNSQATITSSILKTNDQAAYLLCKRAVEESQRSVSHTNNRRQVQEAMTCPTQDFTYSSSTEYSTQNATLYVAQFPTQCATQSPAFGGRGSVGTATQLAMKEKRDVLNQKLKQLPAPTARKAHIFVDMSNIFISFQKVFKLRRGYKQTQHVKTPFSFESLSLILERGRYISTKMMAGSVKCAAHKANPPYHIQEAQRLEYDVNLFVRVQQPSEMPFTNKRAGARVAQYKITTSDDESSDADWRMAEQGVDEHLHFGMTKSMLRDFESPGVMVLATGDAKAAEFSEGFAQWAIEALQRGWHLELVSWRHSMAGEWKKSPFCDVFANQFRILELDDFFDELCADWA